MAQQPPKDNFARYMTITIVAFALLFGFWTLVEKDIIFKDAPKPLVIPSTASEATDFGFAFNADVEGVPAVDIYEDFQCPICQQFESLQANYIDSLITEKKAKVTFHVLSFIGDESVRAANAAACSADEGKFVAFHNAMYANQPATENSGEWSNDRIIDIAKTAGISSDAFSSCVKEGKYQTWVTKAAEAAAKAGVNSTPTVFVNGKEIDRQTEYFSAEKFAAAINRG